MWGCSEELTAIPWLVNSFSFFQLCLIDCQLLSEVDANCYLAVILKAVRYSLLLKKVIVFKFITLLSLN